MVLGLIVLLVAVLLVQKYSSYAFTLRFSAVPDEIVFTWGALRSGNLPVGTFGELFTLFTYSLLHGNLGHLLGNSLYLWIFAAIASELLGARWVIPIFVFTAITGGFCHVALNPDSPIPCLGASGSVMGFQGLYLAMAVRWHLPDPHIWPIARPVPPSRLAVIGVIFLVLDLNRYMGGIENIAYGAHLGGFIGGFLVGGFILRMPRSALPR